MADDHAGLRSAIREVLPEAAVQRCYVHFLRNALDHLPRKADDDCLQELRWLYDRRDVEEVRRDLAAWIAKWGDRYQKLVDWVEDTIEDTFTFYRLPRQHHKHLKCWRRRKSGTIRRRGAGAVRGAGVGVFWRDFAFQKSCAGAASLASVSAGESCRRSSSWMSVAYRDQI